MEKIYNGSKDLLNYMKEYQLTLANIRDKLIDRTELVYANVELDDYECSILNNIIDLFFEDTVEESEV